MAMTREEIDQIIGGQSNMPQTTMTREQIDSILNGNNEGAQTSAPSVSNEIPTLKPVTRQSKPFVWSHEKQNEWLKNYTGGNSRAESVNSETARERATANGTSYQSEYGKVLRRDETRGKGWNKEGETAALDKEAEAKVKKNASLNQPYVNELTKKEEQPQEYQPTVEDLQMFESLSAQIAKDQEKKKLIDSDAVGTPQKQITMEDLYTPEAKQLYAAYGMQLALKKGAEIPQKQSVQIPALDKALELNNKNQQNVNLFLTGDINSTEKTDQETVAIDNNLPTIPKDFQLIKDVEDMTPEEYEFYVLMNSPKNGIPEDATEELKQAFIDKWIQPDYQMSDVEKKQAKKILEENSMYLDDRAPEKAKVLLGLEGQELENFKKKREDFMLLDAKTDTAQQIGAGVMSALPTLEKAVAKTSDAAGYDFNEYNTKLKENVISQNPLAYYGGQTGMQLAKYAAGSGLMKGLGVTDKIGQGTGKVIKNAKLAEHTANVLADTALDVAFDTMPSLAQDVQNGENAGTVAKNAAKNVGGNLMWNVGGEALGAGVDVVKKNKKVNDVLKNPDAFTMETGVRLTGDAGQDKKIVSAYLDELAKATDEIPHLKNDTSDVLTDTVKETESAAEKINVGKATTIYSPYKGEVPVQADKVYNRVEIPQQSYENALINMQNANIDGKLEGRSPKKILTKVYETLFNDRGRTSFDVNVKDMTYGGKAYDVTVNKGAISKIMSDKNMSAEKIAVIDNLENVIADSKYVGSGSYNKTAEKVVVRYDYFETDIKIHGEDYVVTYDVEVVPGKNNYRTHKVINEMNLSKGSQRYTDMGPVPTVPSDPLKGSNNIISDSARNINQNILDKESLPKKEAYLMPDVSSFPKRYVHDEAEFASFNNNISNFVEGVNNEMNLSKGSRFSTGTGNLPAVSSDALKGSDNILSNRAGNVNNPPPSLKNKVISEDIGLGNELPFTTVYDNTQSVAESMGLPDIRKFDSSIGDTLNVGAEKVSKFRANTLAKEANFSAEEAAEIYGENFYKYIPTSEKETFEVAAKRVSDDADGWYKKIMSAEDIKDYDNAAGVDTMMQLSTNYRQQARAAKEAGNTELARTLYAKSRDMTLKLSELERKAGQELQALQKYSRTSDKTILNGEKILQDRITETAKVNPRLMEEVDDVGAAIYNRVRELEQSDLWKQLSSSDAMQPAAADVREQLRKEVSDIIKQEAGKNKALKKRLKNSSIDKLADDIIELNHLDRINSALESFASTGIYGMSDDVIDQVTDIFAEAEKYDFNSKKRVDLESQAYALIAQEVSGTSFHEMFKNWRYLAMLGNTKTHIRNMVSTTGMYATNGVKNNVAAVIEAAVDKASRAAGGNGIERTKAILNRTSAVDNNLIKAALNDADDKMYRELKGNMYTGSIENSIDSNKRVFRGKNKVTDTVAKGVDKISKLNSAALDAEDYFFVKHKYSTSLAGYMKANGLGEDAFEAAEKLQKVNDNIDNLLAAKQSNPFKVVDRAADAEIAALDEQIVSLKNAAGLNPLGQASYIGKMDELEKQAEDIARSRIDDQIAALRDSAKEYQSTVDILDKGRQYAKKQAEETAFHQDSKTASGLSKFSNTMEESGIPGKVVNAMVEGVVPFKKTPVNVLKNGLAYSPANVFKNLTFDIRNLRVKKITPAEFIDSISKTLTGTGIFAMGCALYNSGVATAVTDKFDELTGNQTYSIQIGDKTYTLDWAAPDSISFFAGVSAMEELKEKGISLEGVLNALAGMSQPVMEMSMMDGVNNALESIQYMDKDNIASSAIGTLGGTVGGSYLKQTVPTLMGQIAKTADNTRRSTYTDKTGFAGALDREVIKMTNKIPGLSKNNQPYVDAWGREQENLAGGNLLERTAYQMLSPSYIADVNMTPVDEEVQRLYDATANEAVLPTGDTTKKIDDVRMTKEEYTVYSKAAGQARYDLLASCLDNANYNALDEDVQAEVVKDLYNLAKKIGSAEARVGYTSNDSLFKTYQEKGLDAAVNYAITKQAEDVMWVPISETTNSERYEQVNSMDLSDEEKGYQLRTSANNSEVADKVYEAFGESDSMVYQYYTLDEMAKNDSSNKTEQGEDKSFSGSSLGKQYEYITKMDGSEEEKGKMLATVNSSDEKVQAISGAFGDAAVVAYAQADSMARNDIMNSTEKGEAKSFSQSNITKQYEYVNQLSGVSDEVKGTMIYLNQTSSDKVQKVYSEKGGEGVMEYAKIKNGAHKGSGNLKKDELVQYLNKHYSGNSTKRYWFKMVGNENWKCPY